MERSVTEEEPGSEPDLATGAQEVDVPPQRQRPEPRRSIRERRPADRY